MEMITGPLALKIFLAVIALALVWAIVRAVLKITMKLFAAGCVVLAVLVGIAWLVGWIA